MDEMQIKMLKDYKEMIKKELFTDLAKDMPTCACDYHRHKMISSIIRTINEIDDLIMDGGAMATSYYVMTYQDAHDWVMHMDSDNSKGEHWTIEQTTSVAKSNDVMFDHITENDWYVAMNMIYSDYGKTLEKYGIPDTNTTAYAEITKDFLFDKDAVAPKMKLCNYYKYIVKH